MAEYLTTDTDLQSVADAIRAKSGTSEPLEYPDGFVSAIEDIPTGGGGGGSVAVPEKEVNFYDYDGTCVYSYTPSEFAALTEMPANPSHEGLTAQGWNWSLSDAKTYVADYGMLDVGQMYITDDGKTRIYIHLEQGRTSPMLGICPNGTVDVDWGDGTEHDTLTGTSTSTVKWTPRHNYTSPGDYVIKLTITGSMGLYGSTSFNQYCGLLRHSSSGDSRNTHYITAIHKVEIGSSVTSIGQYAFFNCYGLTSVTIPSGVTSIGRNAFDYCYGLTSITIPSGVTSIDQYAFDYCYGLTNVMIPSSVTNIGQNAFNHCYVLTGVTIPSNVTSISQNAFNYCHGLTSVTIPSGVISIGQYAFGYCYVLMSVTIPHGVTSIGQYAFCDCFVLTSVTIPSSVTSIDRYAFDSCYGLAAMHFQSTTPPTVSNSNAFSNLPADCKIYVPTGSLEAYASATNYPSSTIYTYIEE